MSAQPSRVAGRLAAIAESATLAVDAKAKALQAQGEDVIGFGAGEPDFPTPAPIVEAARAAAADPRNHKYTPAAGLPELREAIAAKTLRDSGVECAAGQVLVTNGGKHAVFTAFAALCDPGDEVLVPAPYWTTYPEAIALAGGVPVVIDTTEATGFQVTIEQLDAAWTPRTKVLLFVSPDNPSGAVCPPEQVEAIGRWAVERGRVGRDRRDLRAPHVRRPPLRVDAGGRARAGRAVHDPERCRQDVRDDRLAGRLDDRAGRRRQGGDQLPEPHHVERVERRPAGGDRRGQRRPVGGGDDARGVRPTGTAMHAALNDIPGVTCIEPQGAFYCFPNLTGLLGRELAGRTCTSTLELADHVLSEAKVAFVPGEAFGAPGYGRFSFAVSDDTPPSKCGGRSWKNVPDHQSAPDLRVERYGTRPARPPRGSCRAGD